MALYEFKGWSPMRGHKKGTVRAKDSREAMDNVLKKKLGGYGEVTVWAKRKNGTKRNSASGSDVEVADAGR